MPKGKYIEGVKLAPNGMCYAHIHGEGKVTMNDMVDYWLHITSGQEKPEATNPAYLALIGEGPVVEATPNQWVTPGAKHWYSLEGLLEYDISIPERYKNKSGIDLSSLLLAVHQLKPADGQAARCLKFLHKDDREALFHDVMEKALVGANKYARRGILAELDNAVKYEAKIDFLVSLFEQENVPKFWTGDAPREMVEELIGRTAWVIISRVMEYRVGMFETIQTSTDTALDLAKTQAQLLLLQRHVKELKQQVEYHGSEAEAEDRASDWDAEQGPARLG